MTSNNLLPEPTITNEDKIDSVTYCSHFGCGKKLSLPETLCGDKCTEHQGMKMDVTNCLSI